MINLQNLTELQPLQPIEIDLAVYNIQAALKSNLTWCTHVYGRAYRYSKISEEVRLVLPEVYIGNTDGRYSLMPVTPDNDKEASVFFVVGNEVPVNFEKNAVNYLRYDVSVVFWVNLELIDEALAKNEDFTQILIKQVRDVLTNAVSGIGFDLKIGRVIRKSEEVFKEFSLSNEQKYMKMPYSCFRFETEITLREDCGNPVDFPPINPFPPYRPKLSNFENDMDFQTGAEVAEKISEAIAEIPSVDPLQFATAEQGEKADTAVQPEDLPNFNDFATVVQLENKADLDLNGKVPLSQINDALIGNVNYRGLYNGIIITNGDLIGQELPVAAPSNKGWYFISIADYTKFGIDFKVGDWIISDGLNWDKIDNTDAVSSVAGKTGNVTLTISDIVGLAEAIAAKPNLGENNADAYRGDRGKIAYDHSQTAGNPHGTTIAQISGLNELLEKTAKVIICDVDNTAATSNTVATLLRQYTIKGGEISAGTLDFNFYFDMTGGNSLRYVRIYANTTGSSGTGLILANQYGNTILSAPLSRNLEIKKDNRIGGYPGTASTNTEQNTNVNANYSALNPANDFIISVYGLVSNVSDSIRMTKCEVTFRKATV